MWHGRGDVRSDNWLLRFRVGYQGGEDEGYRTNCNQSHDYKPNIGTPRGEFFSLS
jgi:hypothetical protein